MTSICSVILAFMLSIGGGANLSVHLGEKPHPGLKIETRELRPIQTELNQEQQPGLRFFIRNSRLRIRFLQTDPMGYEDSMNMYQAFNMNPVNFVDPFGNVTAINAGEGPIRTVNLESGNIILDYSLLNLFNTLLNALGFTINTGLNTFGYGADKLWDGSDWLFAESGISNRGEWVDMRPVVEPYFVANPNTISNSTRHLLNKVDNISYKVIKLLQKKGANITSVYRSNGGMVIVTHGDDVKGGIALNTDEMADILGTGPTSKKEYGVYPVETKRGIRWRMEGKRGFVKAPKKGKIVLGHNPQYVELSKNIDATYLQIPKNAWDKLYQNKQFKKLWRYNENFIHEALKRGDNIIFASDWDRKISYFGRELWLLRNKGKDISKVKKGW